MPDYRRYRLPGRTYFFTVNILQRYPNDPQAGRGL